MSLVLEPFADAELVLCGAEETGLLLGVLLALEVAVSVLLLGAAGGSLALKLPLMGDLRRRGREEPCPVARNRPSAF